VRDKSDELPSRVPYYLISAGEPSGDLLASELVKALAQRCPELRPIGIAGPKMIEAGVEPLATIDDLAVMGFVEVIKHLPRLKLLESELLAQMDRRQPLFAVLVDYPGFHMRLAESLRLRGIKVVQYVAPQLWAWGAKRTEKLKHVTDLVLGIMPFEEDFFKQRGVSYHYVGTPQVDRVRDVLAQGGAMKLDQEAVYCGFFPGSRWGEVSRILPMIRRIRDEMRQRSPDLQYAVSVAPGLPVEAFESLIGTENLAVARHALEQDQRWQQQDTIFVRGQSLKLMAKVDAALVTSGTATLECALTGTPMAVAYVMNNLSYQIARRLVKLPYISLVNLVADRPLIQEYVQLFEPKDVADELLRLLEDMIYRRRLQNDLRGLMERLQGDLADHAAVQIIESLLMRA
jgi:lipid-A-disaccharide synthase